MSKHFAKVVKDTVPGQKRASFLDRVGVPHVAPTQSQLNHRIKSDGWTEDGWRMVDAFVADISAEEARELFINHRFPDNRNANDVHLDNLRERTRGILDLSLGFVDDKIIILNGHQSTLGLALSGKTRRASITIYECKDRLSFGRCYAIFDDNVKRSPAAVAKALEDAFGGFSAPRTWVKDCAAAIRVAKANFPGAKRGKGNLDLQETMMASETQEFSQLIHQLSKSAEGVRRFIPMNVLGALFCCWHAEKDFAAEFIEKYIVGANLSTDDPCFVLREKIGNRGKGTHVSNLIRDHVGWVYQAWMNFAHDKKVTKRSFRNAYAVPEWDDWAMWDENNMTRNAVA